MWQGKYPYFNVGQFNAPAGHGWPAPRVTLDGSAWGYYGVFMPSYASIYVTEDRSNALSGVNKVARFGYPAFVWRQTLSVSGTTLSAVTPWTNITLDWACQKTQGRNVGGSCKSYDAFDQCNSWTGGTIEYLGYYTGAVVNGVARPAVGSITVAPSVTTTYTIYCSARSQQKELLRPPATNSFVFKVVVVDPCPVDIEAAKGNPSGYWLKANTTRRLNNTTLGFNNCLKNISGNDYYIPANTKAELQSFFTNASAGRVPGVLVPQ